MIGLAVLYAVFGALTLWSALTVVEKTPVPPGRPAGVFRRMFNLDRWIRGALFFVAGIFFLTAVVELTGKS